MVFSRVDTRSGTQVRTEGIAKSSLKVKRFVITRVAQLRAWVTAQRGAARRALINYVEYQGHRATVRRQSIKMPSLQ
jgi:hypothetical protein